MLRARLNERIIHAVVYLNDMVICARRADQVKCGYCCIFIIHAFPSENLMNESFPRLWWCSHAHFLTFSALLGIAALRHRGTSGISRPLRSPETSHPPRERSPAAPPCRAGTRSLSRASVGSADGGSKENADLERNARRWIDLLKDVYIFPPIKRFLPWRESDLRLLNVLGS